MPLGITGLTQKHLDQFSRLRSFINSLAAGGGGTSPPPGPSLTSGATEEPPRLLKAIAERLREPQEPVGPGLPVEPERIAIEPTRDTTRTTSAATSLGTGAPAEGPVAATTGIGVGGGERQAVIDAFRGVSTGPRRGLKRLRELRGEF